MNKQEFKQWFEDISRRLPSLGEYLRGLPKETVDVWFADIFEQHDLEDSLAMNLKLMTDGEGVGRFDRDKLPSTFIRTLSEIRYAREHRTAGRNRRPDHIGALGAVRGDAIMGGAYRHVVGLIRKHKQEHGQLPSDEQIAQWTSEHLDANDTSDDGLSGPRYKCFHCRDTGLVSYESHGRTYVGACTKCDAGDAKAKQTWRSGRTLGYAPREAEDNPFNEALAGIPDAGF